MAILDEKIYVNSFLMCGKKLGQQRKFFSRQCF